MAETLENTWKQIMWYNRPGPKNLCLFLGILLKYIIKSKPLADFKIYLLNQFLHFKFFSLFFKFKNKQES